MTAAAGAARTSMTLIGEPSTLGEGAAAVGLAVAGGTIEGLAIGLATYVGLGANGSGLTSRRWIGVTALVAMLAWATGSAPASFSGSGGADEGPPWLLVIVGASVLGLITGAVLGIVQARMLRGHVAHHRRWVLASCLGWAPAMVIIFIGATVPDSSWSTPLVVFTGTVTGLLAGATFGAVSGAVVPSLDGPSLPNRAVLAVLSSRVHALLSGTVVALRITGRRTGRLVQFPVQYAIDDVGLVIFPGHPESKQWWRNLREGARVEVVLRGETRSGAGELITPGDAGYIGAREAYTHRFPRVALPQDCVLVRIDLDPVHTR